MIWIRNATAAPFYSAENQARLLIANERLKKAAGHGSHYSDK
jgi:hypothetical protein